MSLTKYLFPDLTEHDAGQQMLNSAYTLNRLMQDSSNFFGLQLFILILRTLKFVPNISRRFSLISSTMSTAMFDILTFFVIAIFIIMAFTVFFSFTLGSYFFEFSTTPLSLYTVFLGISALWDPSKWYSAEPLFSALQLFLFTCVCTWLLVSIIIAIITDAFTVARNQMQERLSLENYHDTQKVKKLQEWCGQPSPQDSAQSMKMDAIARQSRSQSKSTLSFISNYLHHERATSIQREQTFKIKVVVWWARHVRDVGVKADPYLKILLDESNVSNAETPNLGHSEAQTVTTNAIRNCDTPTWNEAFYFFPLSDTLDNVKLVIAVFDKDRFKEDDLLGYIIVPAHDIVGPDGQLGTPQTKICTLCQSMDQQRKLRNVHEGDYENIILKASFCVEKVVRKETNVGSWKSVANIAGSIIRRGGEKRAILSGKGDARSHRI